MNTKNNKNLTKNVKWLLIYFFLCFTFIFIEGLILLISSKNIINLTSKYIILFISISLVISMCLSVILLYIDYRRNLIANKKISSLTKLHSTKQEYVSVEKIYKHFLLSNLLYENNKHDKVITVLREKFNIQFNNPFFAVCIIYINKSTQINEKEVAYFVVENVINDIFNNIYDVYLTTYKENIVSIINFDSYNLESEKLHIQRLLNKVIDFFATSMKMKLTITQSSIKHDLNNLYKGYTEAEVALEYMTVVGKTKVISYDDLSIENKEGQAHRISILCKQFKTSLHNNDYILAKSKISDIFDILTKSIDTPEKTNYEITLVRSAFYEAISQTNDSKEAIKFYINQHESIDSQMYELKDLKEIYIQTINFLENSYKLKKNNSKEITKDILNYIHENYTSHDLSVNKIAERFNMSSSMITKTFKKDTGDTILKYIHSYRIKEAKKLLRSGHSVNEVSYNLGYVNTMTFIRAFKKHEEITPGKYKDSFKK